MKWTILSYVSNNQQGFSALGYDLSFPKIFSKRLRAKGKHVKNGAKKMLLPYSQTEINWGWRCGNHWSFSVICINLNLYSLNSPSFPGKCRAARRTARSEIAFWKERRALTEDVSFCVPGPGSAPQCPRSQRLHTKERKGEWGRREDGPREEPS